MVHVRGVILDLWDLTLTLTSPRRHPPPPVHHVEHVEHEEHAELQHHHSEPVHFEHHHEELHLPHHRVEHHVEHHETHGASPFFHDESGASSEDYAQVAHRDAPSHATT